MSRARAILAGSIWLTLGEAIGYGASFVRNVFLARILTKADYGIAASFALVIGMLELAGKLAIGQLVIQDREGDQPRFLATAHLLQFLAGVVSACLILALAPFVATVLGLVDRAPAFAWLAVLPVFKGLENLHIRRMARDFKFWPGSLVEAIPQVLVTLLVWPLSHFLADYRLVLLLLLAKGFLSLLAAHLLADRQYRWSFDWSVGRRILSFGWPLLLNSFLMFGVLQADQLLVGANYSIEILAVYAAAALLTLVPGNMAIHVVSSLMLPLLSRAQVDRSSFRQLYRLSTQVLAALSVAYALFTILGAEALMSLVFGPKYHGGGVLLGFLSAANSLRLLRVAPAMAALARADSRNQLYANVLRGTSFLLAAAAAFTGQPIWVLAAAGLVGESVAFAVTVHRLRRRHGLPLGDSLMPASCQLMALGLSAVLVSLGTHSWPSGWSLALAVLLGLAGAALSLSAFNETRTQAFWTLCALRARLSLLGPNRRSAW